MCQYRNTVSIWVRKGNKENINIKFVCHFKNYCNYTSKNTAAQNLTPVYMPKHKNTIWRYRHPSVRWSIIYNSQDMNKTQVSSSRWMDKEDTAPTHNGTLLGWKKENDAICSDLDELGGYYFLAGNKSDRETDTVISLVESKIYNKLESITRRQLTDTENILVVTSWGEGPGRDNIREGIEVQTITCKIRYKDILYKANAANTL